MNIKSRPETIPPSKKDEAHIDEAHIDEALDEALKESFPSSDPVAISVPKPSNTPL